MRNLSGRGKVDMTTQDGQPTNCSSSQSRDALQEPSSNKLNTRWRLVRQESPQSNGSGPAYWKRRVVSSCQTHLDFVLLLDISQNTLRPASQYPLFCAAKQHADVSEYGDIRSPFSIEFGLSRFNTEHQHSGSILQLYGPDILATCIF